jgi:subtilase family serine protease
MPFLPRVTRYALLATAAVTGLACLAAVTSPAAAARTAAARITAAGRITYRHACPPAPAGHATCLAIVDTTAAGAPLTRAAAAADDLYPYQAAELESAYRLPSSLLGERQTVAVVDAYNDPLAAADLSVYRQVNHLPPCTTASGCFAKVNQEGQAAHYPAANGGWAQEESLDLDMVSAACPNCKIILVEASNSDNANLFAAEDEAAALGADAISNSWGETEYPGEAGACDHYFSHPGAAITAAAGDNGFGAEFPATCASVISVGGTTLYQAHNRRGWTETVWNDLSSGDGATGSGCSLFIAKPAWQHDRLCGMRTDNDTAAVADPFTPVAVYDSYDFIGWSAFGGTSVSTQLIAGVYALAGNTAAITPGPYLYAHHAHLFHVTSGSNGDCGGSYLCTAVKGYNGPTGWGTPDGIGAF